KEINENGLELEALENFNPLHWHDILLDGPKKNEQLEGLKKILQNMGKVGIPIMGYCFSIAGVWGWERGNYGRGNAESVALIEGSRDFQEPIPDGMVWNMRYKKGEPNRFVPETSEKEVWERLEFFLEKLLPVAEENHVSLAAHPNDPPLSIMRKTGRILKNPDEYIRLIDINKSSSNKIEMCLGSIQEMAEPGLESYVEKFSKEQRIGYIHFRNVKGKVPNYIEAFVDEGDIDMVNIIKILKKNNYNGVIIPDHTPALNCPSPWHAGMAYAVGYIKGLIQSL
ncbi:MAG: mannonate dehydratase, partial [SAR202 cluster bacterium]|nr:mannonate dehydratase [SAR202 cluster bacterium]